MKVPLILAALCCLLAGAALGQDVALTPPMGWNSWNHFHCGLNEELVRQTADLLVSSGLQKAGYVYVNLDDCWQINRTAEGVIIPDMNKFPNFTGMIQYIKSKGLKFGLYTDRGMETCQKRPGSYGHEKIDAATYASWGVDYVKNDDCNIPKGGDADTDYGHMFEAIHASGRPMVHSVKGSEPIEKAHTVSNMRRVGHDIGDNFASMLSLVMQGEQQNLSQYAHPGFWNDLDMLEIGNGGMTLEEYRTHMAFWAILKAPLLLGNDLTKMSSDVVAILTNAEVLQVNQDVLGVQGKVVHSVAGNSTKAVRPLVAVKCSSADTQKWTYDKVNGTIVNEATKNCIDSKSGSGQAMVVPCIPPLFTYWTYDASGQIRTDRGRTGLCLDVFNYTGPVVQLYRCKPAVPGDYGNEEFNFTSDGRIEPKRDSGLCLDLGTGAAQLYVLAGPLSNKTVAVMLFNEADPHVTNNITASWSDLGLAPTASYNVRDLWEGKDLGTFSGSFTGSVPGHSNMLLKLTPSA